VLELSPLRNKFRVKKSNGSEAIHWDNGSSHGITSSTEKAGHGETLDMGVIDEAFAQEDSRLEQGLRPTMITRPQPQLWVVSTAGTRKSAFLRAKVDAGRQRSTLGVTSGVAYFEWSAPGTADPEDPATWRTCMPALGHTMTEVAIQANRDGMELPEFRRAFLNQWPDDAPEEWLVIPRAAWESLADPGGQIGPYLEKLQSLRNSGQNVIIDGSCLSACTMVLGVIPRDRLCVTARARLGFHSAWRSDQTGRQTVSQEGTELLMSVYPQQVRNWISRRGGLSPQLIYLTGDELTIADIGIYPIYAGRKALIDGAGLKNVTGWGERVGSRPGVQKGMKLES